MKHSKQRIPSKISKGKQFTTQYTFIFQVGTGSDSENYTDIDTIG